MNLQMGTQTFANVQVPLLWGERAIIQDKHDRLSVIDLSGEKARLEVLADEPAPGVRFRPSVDGIVIFKGDVELYTFNSKEKTISSIALGLPEIQISSVGTRVGSNWLSGNVIYGAGVGVAVGKDSVSLGAPLPPKLAQLKLQ